MSPAADTPALTLLVRPGCGLCDDFVEAFAAELPARFAALTIAEVDARDDWRERFGLLIPVLLGPAGEPICETVFDAGRVRAALG